MRLKLIISLILILVCSSVEAQTVRVSSPSQHPYRHMPNELNTIDTAADEECYTYESDTAQGEWQSCGSGSGAPTDADYLVGTANGSPSAEIVVGTTPGGELEGTWGTPTIDNTGVTLTSLTVGALLGVDSIDATGAVDMDYGSADITDHTFITDGTGDSEIVLSDDSIGPAEIDSTTGAYDFGSVTSFEIPNAATDQTLSVAGQIGINTTDEQLSFHSAADGEISGEASISLIRHLTATFDPAGWYDQESTYRVVPLMYVGDDAPEGITITEWKMDYVGGNPTTELDADLMCDTTADYNPAAGATVMDVLDTTTGSSSADTGFDSATCATGSKMYIRFGADPVDANVVVAFDLFFYNEED